MAQKTMKTTAGNLSGQAIIDELIRNMEIGQSTPRRRGGRRFWPRWSGWCRGRHCAG